MADFVSLSWAGGELRGIFRLPASKSESNRALILRALLGGEVANLSEANDTQLLIRLLQQIAAADRELFTLDCEDAGTTLRFLTAYCAVTDRRVVITGSARMRERPVGPLVEALQVLGADIEYLDQPGFPPLYLRGFQYSGVQQLAIRADISSQFISALMLVAPALPHGLTLHLLGRVSSVPYIQLTGRLLGEWGCSVLLRPDQLMVTPPPQQCGGRRVHG